MPEKYYTENDGNGESRYEHGESTILTVKICYWHGDNIILPQKK